MRGARYTSPHMNHQVKDIELAPEGAMQIELAAKRMPVLSSIRQEVSQTKPLAGHRIAGCLHVTKEAAVLVRVLRAAGAEVAWCGCNPLSTQDDVAAALAAEGVAVRAWHGMSTQEFYQAVDQTLAIRPTLTIDDGADLIFRIHERHTELLHDLYGGTEETTTGIIRLRAMAAAGELRYPVIAVNDAETKWDFDNVYGTGQSTLDGIIRATSMLIAGKVVVVAGYGHCGRGIASRAKGLGARVIITEVNPIAALKATLEGFEVLPMEIAATQGDLFVTATGMRDIAPSRPRTRRTASAWRARYSTYQSASRDTRAIAGASEQTAWRSWCECV